MNQGVQPRLINPKKGIRLLKMTVSRPLIGQKLHFKIIIFLFTQPMLNSFYPNNKNNYYLEARNDCNDTSLNNKNITFFTMEISSDGTRFFFGNTRFSQTQVNMLFIYFPCQCCRIVYDNHLLS